MIDGALHWRGTPTGKWEPCRVARLNAVLVATRKAVKDLRSFEYKRGHCIHQRDLGDRCMCVECIENRADAVLASAEKAAA